jgi:hypothetical protein
MDKERQQLLAIGEAIPSDRPIVVRGNYQPLIASDVDMSCRARNGLGVRPDIVPELIEQTQ